MPDWSAACSSKNIPNWKWSPFGPTLRGVHSPDERLKIATVPKFWDLLLEVLKTV